MAQVVSVTGVGFRGGAGVQVGTDLWGTLEMVFDAKPWEEQPSDHGQLVVNFEGGPPTRFAAVDGWAVLDAHIGPQTTILWHSSQPVQPGTKMFINYSG